MSRSRGTEHIAGVSHDAFVSAG